ncbi:putative regulatory protein [Mycobacterium xenopi 4042]|uniref:Putative regulatory protein n=1 Tax=Mycobacterium xenopi 4042 TaxID=1299334 RepID=X8AFZ0_MYCXE|nr:putative regulatory protein [Mycobacterium xenopi 4042]
MADHIGVHRTIAYRLLTTLAQFRLLAKGEDGRYRSASGLAVLGASFDNNVRQLSMPILRALADDLGTTVSLLVAEGDQQVAIAVVVPSHLSYQLSFHEGSRYPLDRGAAGIALLASMPVRPASGTWCRRRDNRAGCSLTARSSRTPTAWPCRFAGARRRRRPVSTSSRTEKTW